LPGRGQWPTANKFPIAKRSDRKEIFKFDKLISISISIYMQPKAMADTHTSA